MGRREQREQIFKLVFQLEFNDVNDMPEQMKLYLEQEEIQSEKDCTYISEKFESPPMHRPMISSPSQTKNWKIEWSSHPRTSRR